MEYSKNGLHLTERFEGCALRAYRDIAGVPTIGYGHTAGVQPGMVCTQEQAEAWLLDDVDMAARAVNQLVTASLTQNEFDALVDFVFNVGIGNFRDSTLLKMLNAGDYSQAAGQFARWDKAGGVEVAGLLARRQAEETEFLDELDPC